MKDNKTPDEVEKKLEELVTDIKKADPELRETKLSEWVRKNKDLLVSGGTVVTGAAKAIAWIVENVDNIREFLDVASSIFGSKDSQRTLDLDALQIGTESLIEALDEDPVLSTKVLLEIMAKYGFDAVHSRNVDLVGKGIFL